MKHINFLLLLSVLMVIIKTSATQSIELNIMPTWQQLDTNPLTIKQFGGKWILAGIIEIKKKAPQTIRLDKLVLHWQGSHLPNLLGSLYKKEFDKKFIPLEENLICDSHWDNELQNLILKFDASLNLEAHNTLCLVLTIPTDVERTLLQGSFQLESTTLPSSVQQSLANPIRLVCRPKGTTKHI